LTPEITRGDWTQDIANLLLYEDLSGAVLVGHSQGGIVCQAVAEAAPERIGRLVFIDAPVLRDGECALDAMPAEILAKYGPTPPNAVIPPTPLTPNEFLDTVETAWVNERLTGAPTNPSLETIAVRRSAHLPRHYLSCRQTPPFFPSVFTRRRLEREGVEFTWLDAPHDCPLTHPAQTAEFIETVCVS
jgi:pimeloyl-ACP methyl ester carboxylesterase